MMMLGMDIARYDERHIEEVIVARITLQSFDLDHLHHTRLCGAAAVAGSLCLLTTVANSAWGTEQGSDGSSSDSGSAETVVVTGRRLSQASQAIGLDEVTSTVSVTREALLSAPSGISGLKMLEQLPGFNVQTDGALGLYEFGNSVTVRAFNLEQIGFLLDGIPMGRSDAFGGSPIFRYVDNENLASVQASPGAGDVALASYASLGPIVNYATIRPSDDFSAFLSQTFGDDNLRRSFARLETGDLQGFRAYLSVSETDSDLWRGAGSIDREHFEAKALYQFSDRTLLQFNFVSNDFFDYDSPSMNRETYESSVADLGGASGRDRGYIGFVPGLTDPNPGNGIEFDNSDYTYYYGDRVNIRKDKLYGLNFDGILGDAVSLKSTAYYEDKDGYGVSPDSYSNTLSIYNRQAAAGLPVTAPRGVQYGLSGVGGDRKGLVAGIEWLVGSHVLAIGGWYEDDEYNRSQLRFNKTGGNPAGTVIENEVAYFRRDYTSTRKTTQLYLKDTVSLLDDRLAVEAGFKSLNVDYALAGYRDYNDYALSDGTPGYGPQRVSADYSENFLPLIGAVWHLSATEQLFASWSKNFALPRGADDVFSVANTPTPPPAPDGEKAINYEVGFRSNHATFNTAVALFYSAFDNRLEDSNVFNPATGQPETYTANVGETEAYGMEATGQWKPEFLNDYAYFAGSVTYNHTEFKDDFNNLGIAGNTLPDSPEWLLIGGITVEPATWLIANLSAKYTGSRFSNYTNTEKMEAYTVLDAYVDIGDGLRLGSLNNVRLRLNVDNLTDKDVLAFTFTTISGNAFFRPLNPRTLQLTLSGEF